MVAYDRLLVAHANDVFCRGHEYIRGRSGYDFYGSHFSHGYVYEYCDDLFHSFVGCFDIYSIMSPGTRMIFAQKSNVKLPQYAEESRTI